jgi:hypothetical protein
VNGPEQMASKTSINENKTNGSWGKHTNKQTNKKGGPHLRKLTFDNESTYSRINSISQVCKIHVRKLGHDVEVERRHIRRDVRNGVVDGRNVSLHF